MKTRLFLLVALFALVAACEEPAAETTTTGPNVTTTSALAGTTTTNDGTTTSQFVETTTTVASVPLIRVENGEKSEGLDTLSVRAGEQVVFDVIADVDDEVHVHGYDLLFEVAAGEVTRVEFTAENTGIFEVELEGAGLQIVDIEVTP